MKAIFLSWTQNRKAPNKAIDALRTDLAEFCTLFNGAPFPIEESTAEDQQRYVVNVVNNAIQRMERISRVKKGMLWMSVSQPNEGIKQSCIWLTYGTDNGGINLGTISITLLQKEDPKKIDVFVGPAESGKTRKAKELYDGKNVVWLDGRKKWLFKTPYIFANVTSETEIIIIDDLLLNLLGPTVHLLYSSETITVNAKHKKPFTIPRPKILITCCALSHEVPQDHSTRRRVNYTFFPEGGEE